MTVHIHHVVTMESKRRVKKGVRATLAGGTLAANERTKAGQGRRQGGRPHKPACGLHQMLETDARLAVT